MSETETNRMLKMVNSSGFPLQLGVDYQIETSFKSHGWRVLSREHPWQAPLDGGGGFIDLVIRDKHDVGVMIIECKRVRDSEWCFLVLPKNMERHHARFWLSNFGDQPAYSYWTDGTVFPVSPMAEFCVVPGQDSKSKPMLERVANEVMSATEAFANEEWGLKCAPFRRAYFSVIVTTAKIMVCPVDPTRISLDSGELSSGDFRPVPFVRFSKSLTTFLPEGASFNDIRQAAKAKERTVFVVSSSSLMDLLYSWEINVDWPWGLKSH